MRKIGSISSSQNTLKRSANAFYYIHSVVGITIITMKILSFCLVSVLLFTTAKAQTPGLRFYLYTKANNAVPQELIANASNSITNSNFVNSKPVKILAHGYTSNYLLEFPQDLKNAYLTLTNDYNVIAVDWKSLAQAPYETAAANTRVVGLQIAKLIDAIISTGKADLTHFHFIGHSLGGQVGAFISSNLAGGNRKIPRITGLDPGRPGFENTVPAADRLDPTDADFVDVITTSCGIGCTSTTPDPPRGTVDFYPNGGLKQPGCLAVDLAFSGLCSHNRSYKFYAESLTTNAGFKSYKCRSYQDFESGCVKTQAAFMGEYVSNSVTGTYYLTTNAQSPFAKG